MTPLDQIEIPLDITEYCFLLEACIPPVPIARQTLWNKCIDKHFDLLSDDNRQYIFNWISKTDKFIKGLENKNELCILFRDRFDPNNQYEVIVEISDEEEQIYHCFYHNGRNYIKPDQWVNPDSINDVYDLYL